MNSSKVDCVRESDDGVKTFVWIVLETVLLVPSGGSTQGCGRRKSHGILGLASDDEGRIVCVVSALH
jgi:hypothetical protein